MPMVKYWSKHCILTISHLVNSIAEETVFNYSITLDVGLLTYWRHIR